MTELFCYVLHAWWLTNLLLVTTLSSFIIVRRPVSGGLYDDVWPSLLPKACKGRYRLTRVHFPVLSYLLGLVLLLL